jgi:ATP-binding cassette, subfamily B, bacterial PglK
MMVENTLYKAFSLISKKQRKRFYLLIFFLFVGMILEAFGIGIILPVLNVIVSPEGLKQINWVNDFFVTISLTEERDIIFFSLSLLIGVYFFKSLYLVLLSHYQNRYISFISSEIYNRLFENYLKQSFMFHNDRNSAMLIKIFQIELGHVTYILTMGGSLITEIAITISIITTLLIVEPIGTLFIIVFFLIFGSIFYYFSKKKALEWGAIREIIDSNTSKLITEGLNGISEVILLGKQPFFKKRLAEYNKTKVRIHSNQLTLNQIPRYYLEFVSIVSLVGFILIMIHDNKNVSEIIAVGGVFVAAIFRVLPSVNRILTSLQQIKYYASSVDLVSKDLRLTSLFDKNETKNEEVTFKEQLKFENISFTYPKGELAVLDKLDFELNYGEVIGIIGQSGVGKSTLTNLIVGFLHQFKGVFTVDGKQIDQSNIVKWRKQLGYVSQHIYLIDDTIQANIAFGVELEKVDHERIEMAIKKAQLQAFIQSLPNKLDTIVGERGTQLSGGQQQRIGIARALYHDPKLLILDEATSALDETTEKNVMNAIEGLKGEMTILIITHRLSTLVCCDKIFKVHKGKLVEQTSI